MPKSEARRNSKGENQFRIAVLRQSLTKWSWCCLGEQVPALKVLTHVCYSEGTWPDPTLREIGVMFCGLDYAAVSQRVRRIQRWAETDKKLRGVFEILNV